MLRPPKRKDGNRRAPVPAPREFIYRSSYLHEADLVANELERLRIAFYRAEEGPMGVRWAMPVFPAWEPGTCLLIIVPPGHAKRARSLVRSLPVSQDTSPGVWQPGMTDADKEIWRVWAWASLVVVAVGLIWTIWIALKR